MLEIEFFKRKTTLRVTRADCLVRQGMLDKDVSARDCEGAPTRAEVSLRSSVIIIL